MRLRIALFCLALAMVPAGAAYAAVGAEQAQGGALVRQLGSGAKSCADLSGSDLDHIGEYLMGRALGSTALHQAMNDRMRAVLGDSGETRMHQLMGARVAGCDSESGYGAMGPAMMAGYAGMMSSGDWGWMTGGAWRHMSAADWRRVEDRLAGTSAVPAAHHGWSPWWLVALAAAAVVLAAVAVALLVRRACAPPSASS